MDFFEPNEWSRKFVIRLSLIVGILGFAFLIFQLTITQPKASQALTVIQEEFSRIPPIPQTKEIQRSSKQQPYSIFFWVNYQTSMDYTKIREHYQIELSKVDWKFETEKPLKVQDKDYGGKELDFTKGKYRISIFYPGNDSNSNKTYDVSFSWSYW